MKYFVDGDQLVITKDDFVDLQESAAMFFPLNSIIAKTVLKRGILGLSVGALTQIVNTLNLETERMKNRCVPWEVE